MLLCSETGKPYDEKRQRGEKHRDEGSDDGKC